MLQGEKQADSRGSSQVPEPGDLGGAWPKACDNLPCMALPTEKDTSQIRRGGGAQVERGPGDPLPC